MFVEIASSFLLGYSLAYITFRTSAHSENEIVSTMHDLLADSQATAMKFADILSRRFDPPAPTPQTGPNAPALYFDENEDSRAMTEEERKVAIASALDIMAATEESEELARQNM